MSLVSQAGKYFLRAPGAVTTSLGLAHSYWALQDRPLSIRDAVAEAWDEGYHFFEAGLHEDRLADIRSILKETPVGLIAQGWAETAPETEIYFQRAVDLGALAINLHLGHAYLLQEEAVILLTEVQEIASRYSLPLLLETHRGRMTQDLFRVVPLLPYLKTAAVVLDVSHYLVAGEGLGGSEDKFYEHMEPLLARTAMIHGRVSNGQQVQVAESSPLAYTTMVRNLWQRAMELWMEQAPPDAVMVFEPELGPPPYAYLRPEGVETFDRAAESRVLAKMARDAWAAAQEAMRGRA